MRNYKEHLILNGSKIRIALEQLGKLTGDAVLFVVNQNDRLLGSLTDGDVRRGLLNGLSTNHEIDSFIQDNPKYIVQNDYELDDVISLRNGGFKIIPVVSDDKKVINVINFRYFKSFLPIDALVMAGGRGSRLMPLTEKIPKPLLKINDKEIVSYNFDRLLQFGISNQYISVNYLGNLIRDFCSNYNSDINFNIVDEEDFLGTAGSLALVEEFENDYILLMNSDLLTNIDFEDLFKTFLKKDSDFIVASVSHYVDLPYAILEVEDDKVVSFEEKPTYTYYANAGIYLFKKELLKFIPRNVFYDATDFMKDVKQAGLRISHYPINGYWLDIGKHEDFIKAQKDIKHLKL